MSRIAKVWTMSNATNQYLWPFLADFHRAVPFHGRTHSRIRAKNQMFCKMNGSICGIIIELFQFIFKQNLWEATIN